MHGRMNERVRAVWERGRLNSALFLVYAPLLWTRALHSLLGCVSSFLPSFLTLCPPLERSFIVYPLLTLTSSFLREERVAEFMPSPFIISFACMRVRESEPEKNVGSFYIVNEVATQTFLLSC